MKNGLGSDRNLVFQIGVAEIFFIDILSILADQYLGAGTERGLPGVKKRIQLLFEKLVGHNRAPFISKNKRKNK